MCQRRALSLAFLSVWPFLLACPWPFSWSLAVLPVPSGSWLACLSLLAPGYLLPGLLFLRPQRVPLAQATRCWCERSRQGKGRTAGRRTAGPAAAATTAAAGCCFAAGCCYHYLLGFLALGLGRAAIAATTAAGEPLLLLQLLLASRLACRTGPGRGHRATAATAAGEPLLLPLPRRAALGGPAPPLPPARPPAHCASPPGHLAAFGHYCRLRAANCRHRAANKPAPPA
jgi:hypothetical protein